MPRDTNNGERRLRGVAAVLEGDERACVLDAAEEIRWLKESHGKLLAACKEMLKNFGHHSRGGVKMAADAIAFTEGGPTDART